MRVSTYWNLHKNVYSVQHKGRVIKHAPYLTIHRPTFVVQPAGRAKVLEEKKKNVHAFVRGTFMFDNIPDLSFLPVVRASYNPYKAGHFIRVDTGIPLLYATSAYLFTNEEGRPEIWVYEPNGG